jgi:hypothetical protein
MLYNSELDINKRRKKRTDKNETKTNYFRSRNNMKMKTNTFKIMCTPKIIEAIKYLMIGFFEILRAIRKY